jgi:hypothetical protein
VVDIVEGVVVNPVCAKGAEWRERGILSIEDRTKARFQQCESRGLFPWSKRIETG